MRRVSRVITGAQKRLYGWFPPAQRLARQAIYWGRETLVFGFRNPKRMAAGGEDRQRTPPVSDNGVFVLST